MQKQKKKNILHVGSHRLIQLGCTGGSPSFQFQLTGLGIHCVSPSPFYVKGLGAAGFLHNLPLLDYVKFSIWNLKFALLCCFILLLLYFIWELRVHLLTELFRLVNP